MTASAIAASAMTASAITVWSRVIYNEVTFIIVADPFPHRKRGVTKYYSAPLERGA